jgi:hypothetical protein
MLAKLHFVAFNEQLQIGSDTIEIKFFGVAQTFFSQRLWKNKTWTFDKVNSRTFIFIICINTFLEV